MSTALLVTNNIINFLSSLPGYIFITVISLCIIGYFLFKAKKQINIRILTFSALCIALSTIASNIKIFSMASGGSVTLCSMLFICIIGYWFGPSIGFLAGLVAGLLQLVFNAYILNLTQLVLDYLLAFAVLGLAGYFKDKRYGLQTGYIFAVFLRFFISTISGFLFFLFNPDAIFSSFIASAIYNTTYIVPELIITLFLISIPSLKKTIDSVK